MGQYLNAKTYVVAWINWFDHELHQQQVQALHEYHAIEIADQDIFEAMDLHMIPRLHDLKIEAFNRDSMISVIEIE